jgi:hypothetical protein
VSRVGQNYVYTVYAYILYIYTVCIIYYIYGVYVCIIYYIYTVCIRYFWLGNYQIYGPIRCIHTVPANPRSE